MQKKATTTTTSTTKKRNCSTLVRRSSRGRPTAKRSRSDSVDVVLAAAAYLYFFFFTAGVAVVSHHTQMHLILVSCIYAAHYQKYIGKVDQSRIICATTCTWKPWNYLCRAAPFTSPRLRERMRLLVIYAHVRKKVFSSFSIVWATKNIWRRINVTKFV